MGLLANLERRNHELEQRLSHLEAAFEGLRQLAIDLLRKNEMNKVRYYNFVGEFLGEDGEVLCDEPRFVDIQSYEALERHAIAADRVLEEATEQMRGMVARSRLDAVEGELTAAQEKLAKVQRDAGAEIERLQSRLNELGQARCQ